MLDAFGLDREVLDNKFKALVNDVKLLLFTRETYCPYCNETGRLLKRLSAINHKIKFDSYNFSINKEKEKEYHVFDVPALAIIGKKDYGIRYYGYPRGNGLKDFIDDIIYISKGESTLKPEVTMKLDQFTKPTQLKIFISRNCLFSLPVARLAIKLAISNDTIHVDIIQTNEFLELAEKYNVRGTPMTVINDEKSFYGALEEEKYLNQILELA